MQLFTLQDSAHGALRNSNKDRSGSAGGAEEVSRTPRQTHKRAGRNQTSVPLRLSTESPLIRFCVRDVHSENSLPPLPLASQPRWRRSTKTMQNDPPSRA